MATRARGWGGESAVPDPVVKVTAPDQHVTPDVIDAALGAVEREYGVSAEVSSALRKLLSADHTSGVAHAYYGGLASRGLQMSQVRALRKDMSIPYALTESQVTALVAYAPDFKLTFRSTDSHDHPVYAAQRMIDQVVCESRMPPGCTVSDIGGSSLHHAKRGNLQWHVCNPKVDPKDPVRHVLVNLSHKKLAADATVGASTREYSRRFLAGDERLSCGTRAQLCRYKSDAAVAVHVYDIPMTDWAGIMEAKGLRLVEGCILFSDKLFASSAGEFPSAGVRYECDVRADKYAMGFVGSPAWWYVHSLKDHLRYGADQVLYGKTSVYSYKIVERRQDTVFYRILRIGSNAKPDVSQVYKLPGVQMVSVTGLEISTAAVKDRGLVTWNWPQPLWSAMVNSAADAFERGTFTTEMHFNKYRSVAPRQTINSQLVFGGHTVRMQERVALVVYSALEAVTQVAHQHAAFGAMAREQYKQRKFTQASGLGKFLMSLGTVVDGATRFVCSALTRVGESLVKGEPDSMLSFYSVAPAVRLRMIPAQVVLAKNWSSSSSYSPDSVLPDFRGFVSSVAPSDMVVAAPASAAVASVMLDEFGEFMDAAYKAKLESKLGKTQQSAVSESETLVDDTSKVGVTEIVESIKEAIVEANMEAANVGASCRKFRDECMLGAQVNVDMLKRKKEEMMQPDFWYVKKGVITHSALGRAGDEYDLGAILLPVENALGGFLHPVKPVVFSGMSQGKHVVREHATVAGTEYEGWGFANESLKIYNGPEIVASMQAALDMVRPLKVVLEKGPAGCGKTTAIVTGLRVTDVVLAPPKASVLETRQRIQEKRPELAFPVGDRCRTVDSYLVNALGSGKVRGLSTDCLKGDEAFMTRSGRWYACALLLGAKELRVYGDPEQIPHVPRALCPQVYLRLHPSEVVASWITYRCPHDALAAVGDLYGWCARSASQVARSLYLLPTHDSRPVEDGHVMLCMYQDDKLEIEKLYKSSSRRIKVMTVHEAQGNTFKHVRLHRFVRGKNQTDVPDAFDLFQKSAYVLVAMTRHTHSFQYFTQMGADSVVRRIQSGSSPTRINAAADVASAGVPMEHC